MKYDREKKYANILKRILILTWKELHAHKENTKFSKGKNTSKL